MKNYLLPALAATLFFTSCITSRKGAVDGKSDFIVLQLNDVYEISPIEDGKAGGMARVATIRKRLLQENKNTITILSGDFLNPSIIGTLKYEGKSINGKHMVETMNALGVDYVTFGNHEFDFDLPTLQSRLDESHFTWVVNDAFLKQGVGLVPFFKNKNGAREDCPPFVTLPLSGAGQVPLKLGIFGEVLDATKKDYMAYRDVFESAKKAVDQLKEQSADVIIGLTHLNLADDEFLAAQNPSVALILGGHDHSHSQTRIGNVIITKADANAKTVWVHRFQVNKNNKKVSLKSELVTVNEKTPEDPEVAAVVQKWSDIAEKNFTAIGINLKEKIADFKTPLDARSSYLRSGQTEIGAIVAKAMSAAARQKTDCAFFNSGSFRMDDFLKGEITQLDVVRLMPFGGRIVEMDITGVELQKVLLTGPASVGSGSFLLWTGVDFDSAGPAFKINGAPLDPDKTYHIAVADYIFSGKSNGLEFFNASNPAVSNISQPDPSDKNDLRNDVRRAVIEYIKKNKM